MKATRLILVLALSTGAGVAFTVPAAAADAAATASPYRTYAGAEIVVHNEMEKHRLEAQGFPQYTD